MTVAQLVSNIKCELASKASSILNFHHYGTRCNDIDYNFSLVELELLLLENIHYLDIEDHSLLLQRNYKGLCNKQKKC